MIWGRGHGIAGGKFDDANRLFDNIQRVCAAAPRAARRFLVLARAGRARAALEKHQQGYEGG
jgi:hypothetical protein